MRDVLFVTIATRCARFILLLAWTVAILSPSRARADAFPDTVFFNGFDPCVGVQCFQVHCPAGQTTSVSGTVYAPNGTLPLPNVEVYVPNATLAAFTDGPNAPRCDQAPSGHPLVATLTDASGNFTLKNMPATTNVPVVLLAGKWRRQITVASVRSARTLRSMPPIRACRRTTPRATSRILRLPRAAPMRSNA